MQKICAKKHVIHSLYWQRIGWSRFFRCYYCHTLRSALSYAVKLPDALGITVWSIFEKADCYYILSAILVSTVDFYITSFNTEVSIVRVNQSDHLVSRKRELLQQDATITTAIGLFSLIKHISYLSFTITRAIFMLEISFEVLMTKIVCAIVLLLYLFPRSVFPYSGAITELLC